MTEASNIESGALYTLKEARTYLRISDATARRWLKSGLLRGQRIGRDYRVRGEDLRRTADWHARPMNILKAKQPFGPDHPMLKLIGMADSGIGDLAENHDKYLAEIYEEEARPR